MHKERCLKFTVFWKVIFLVICLFYPLSTSLYHNACLPLFNKNKSGHQKASTDSTSLVSPFFLTSFVHDTTFSDVVRGEGPQRAHSGKSSWRAHSLQQWLHHPTDWVQVRRACLRIVFNLFLEKNRHPGNWLPASRSQISLKEAKKLFKISKIKGKIPLRNIGFLASWKYSPVIRYITLQNTYGSEFTAPRDAFFFQKRD